MKTTNILRKCLILYFLYSGLVSMHEDLVVYPSLYLSRYTFCCKKVKPGWMQDYYKCIFWPWIQYNLYNITRVLLPLTFTSFQEDKNKRFRVHVSGINKNVIVHAVGDILIFLCQNFSDKALEIPVNATFKLWRKPVSHPKIQLLLNLGHRLL